VTATEAAGTNPDAIAVNSVTNKVHVANSGGTVTVIDGATNATTTVAVSSPVAIAVDSVTNKVYVANGAVFPLRGRIATGRRGRRAKHPVHSR
jgi:DNA-binding beta-propeller fold protein YncE